MPVLLVDTPSPFAPTKELQDFLAEWENSPEAQWSPDLLYSLRAVREYLALEELQALRAAAEAKSASSNARKNCSRRTPHP